ncbi:ribosomal protein S5 domain 2-type protein [Calycina marina]|uniref:Small ribosomal subunit protein uS9m n=1 Tax=Calycina marina TaxID=1763456 RepID=A0A9P7ZAB7_9HELO|nr:ribosomal protein S5 domain 2-type protein [Calycina marina]
MKIAWLPAGVVEGVRCACLPRKMPLRPLIGQQTFFPGRRQLSTTPVRSASASITAASPISFVGGDKKNSGDATYKDATDEIFYARLVPYSPSYFTAQPYFIDDVLEVEKLAQKYAALPVVKRADAPRIAWITLMEYRDIVGERVNASKYKKVLHVLQRLNQIHPTVMPWDVKKKLKQYTRNINPYKNVPKPGIVDEGGRAIGVGKRKSSTARAWLIEGNGEVMINGKTLSEAFGRIHDRESVIWGLKATDRLDKYNVWGLVEGGGTTGQAEALTLAVAKALIAHEPALKPALRRAGCVTRDPRKVERKKPGHVKARKMPAWVKR